MTKGGIGIESAELRCTSDFPVHPAARGEDTLRTLPGTPPIPIGPHREEVVPEVAGKKA